MYITLDVVVALPIIAIVVIIVAVVGGGGWSPLPCALPLPWCAITCGAWGWTTKGGGGRTVPLCHCHHALLPVVLDEKE